MKSGKKKVEDHLGVKIKEKREFPLKIFPGKKRLYHILARHIDHTLLKPHTTLGEVENLCQEAKEWNFGSIR